MTVYFVQPERGGLVKIGFTTKSVPERVRELQTGCPDKLVVLATEDGGESKEAELHEEFADLRVVGEWFKPDVRLMRRILVPGRVQAELLKAYAQSYVNCLWSHCSSENVDQKLVTLLWLHAEFVACNAQICWSFLEQRGVDRVHEKYCQYFFALCWPIHRPWMELNRFVLQELREAGEWDGELPFSNMAAETRSIDVTDAVAGLCRRPTTRTNPACSVDRRDFHTTNPIEASTTATKIRPAFSPVLEV